MRRDYFSLEFLDADEVDRDESGVRTLVIEFDGPSDLLTERLTDADGELLDGSEIDAAFRFQSPDREEGVFSITNRINGDFVLEANARPDDVVAFVDAVRETDDDEDGDYRIVVDADGERRVTYDKRTLLVYDHEGSLLRQDSLIPGGVEL
ncbi:hypothetical protein BRC83_08735 [Halobacteriales archaeon QS_1_68_17]|nr:MAG: hypothetical protein BRC83_08735 [Halobacteriales archaeon QS_1_68_17]